MCLLQKIILNKQPIPLWLYVNKIPGIWLSWRKLHARGATTDTPRCIRWLLAYHGTQQNEKGWFLQNQQRCGFVGFHLPSVSSIFVYQPTLSSYLTTYFNYGSSVVPTSRKHWDMNTKCVGEISAGWHLKHTSELWDGPRTASTLLRGNEDAPRVTKGTLGDRPMNHSRFTMTWRYVFQSRILWWVKFSVEIFRKMESKFHQQFIQKVYYFHLWMTYVNGTLQPDS